jgi:hypothetical protein
MNPEPNPNPNPNPIQLPKPEAITNALGSITGSIADARSGLNNAVSDFSSKTTVDAGSEFLESNTIVAKFAFIIVALIAFMILFRIGVIILSYFLSPSSSPYLVKGQIDGNEAIEITQDSRTSNPLVKFSENKSTGVEFTYSVWLYLKGQATGDKNHHIFNKGIYDKDTADDSNKGTNSPGLFVKTNADGTSSLNIFMDTMENDGSVPSATGSTRATVEITSIPHNKWTNVIIRIENRILDVYINGVLTNRKDLVFIPRQNYGSVFVCQSGGFAGKLSDLRYYDNALNVFQINQVVTAGPSTGTSGSATAPSSGFYYFLSSQFYKNNVA